MKFRKWKYFERFEQYMSFQLFAKLVGSNRDEKILWTFSCFKKWMQFYCKSVWRDMLKWVVIADVSSVLLTVVMNIFDRQLVCTNWIIANINVMIEQILMEIIKIEKLIGFWNGLTIQPVIDNVINKKFYILLSQKNIFFLEKRLFTN